MQVPVEVSVEMRQEAESRGLPVIDYVEMLVERGRQAVKEDTTVTSAIERIRALRSSPAPQR